MADVHYNTATRVRNRKPAIKVQLIATDDYGDMALVQCPYTEQIFSAQQGVVRGAVLPQAAIAFLTAPDSEAAFKISLHAFHEHDQNCNTCQFLQRVPHDKRSGFMHGKCTNPAKMWEAHPYQTRFAGDVMLFHPDDWMGMPCYQPRWSAV